jgi:energy-converting hydrogenase A subunit R
MGNLVCFDLEGPLSPQDNAYEVMRLMPDGGRVFEVISRYDDLLALEGREGYEPGDTLALIVPFLICHGIREEDVKEVSRRASLVKGASELVASLKAKGWEQYIVSTSYEQHAYQVAGRLGLGSDRVVCTRFPLDKLRREVGKEELGLVSEVERYILDRLYDERLGDGVKDKAIKPYLDRFYWRDLLRTSIGVPNKTIEVVGGRRKAWAMERIAREQQTYLEGVAFVGDSITDTQGARIIEAAGGLAIAFNGNSFVIPQATVGVASTDLLRLEPILDAWREGGREGAKSAVEAMPRPQVEGGPFYDWLVGRKGKALARILAAHKRTRSLMRGEAAKLG